MIEFTRKWAVSLEDWTASYRFSKVQVTTDLEGLKEWTAVD